MVSADLKVSRNPSSSHGNKDLVFDGDASSVTLKSASVNGSPLTAGEDYTLSASSLVVHESATDGLDDFILSTVVEIVPEDNTQLSGFYKSGPMYCSQCEAEGFR